MIQTPCQRKIGPFQCCSVVEGDCLELMKLLPDKCVDLVLTSPPFLDEDVNGDYWLLFDSWWKEIGRMAALYSLIIHSPRRVEHIFKNYPPFRMMVWGKNFSSYTFRFNPIYVYRYGEPNPNRLIWSDTFGCQPVMKQDKQHPYQDPDLLYLTLVEMFRDCETILDPFMGSGTTAIACMSAGRHFLGFEVNSEYAEISRRRISEVLAQGNLFQPKAEQQPMFAEYRDGTVEKIR